MRHRNDNMLLRIAQGDAFAAAVEYVKRKEHPELYEAVRRFDSYQQHPTHKKLRPGMYTDDTQMSIAVAEVLIYDKTGDWDDKIDDPENDVFAERFWLAHYRDPRDGYSRGFQKILEEAKDPTHMRQLIVPDSNKNGAAMRSVPIGVLKDPKEVVRIAGTQAQVTHATYGGINSAVTVALMSHYALYDRRSFSSMLGWGLQYCPAFEHFREPWVGPVQDKSKDGKGLGVGLNTAWAVHTLLVEETSLRGIMDRVITWGGDTDSVASIAWGIASARYQDEVIPEFLERDLEATGNLKYGPAYLKELGKRLMDAYDV